MGLLLDARRARRHPRAGLALPRLLHGRRLRRPSPLPGVGSSGRSTGCSGPSPEQEQTWKRYAGSLVIFSAVSIGVHLPDHPHPGVAPAQPPAPRRGQAGALVQHGHLVRHQHQLAELRRRDDDVVLLPDRRADRPAVRHARRSGIAVAIALVRGFSRKQLAHHRQLLGGRDPVPPLHPASDRLRGRDHLRGPGRRADAGRARSSSTTS